MKKIQQDQIAPDFTAATIDGNPFKLSDLRGKKVLLNFHRNVGCPVCNLRYHSLQQHASYFKTHHLEVIDVYESTPELMRSYLDGVQPYSQMIPNPELDLYRLYKVERSVLKIIKGLFNGAMGKIRAGKALSKNTLKQDGNMDRIGAEFLIDANGKIALAHYNSYLGDHISLDRIRDFIENE